MKKFLNITFFVLVVLAIVGFVFFGDDIVAGMPVHADPATSQCAGYPNGVCESCTLGQCTGKDATPPDPNRPYFDGCGNEYDYMGNLIAPATVNTPGCPTIDQTPVVTPPPVTTQPDDTEGGGSS